MLGLMHRGGKDFDDGVPGPIHENLMHPHNGSAMVAQDLDLIQTRAVRYSPVLRENYT